MDLNVFYHPVKELYIKRLDDVNTHKHINDESEILVILDGTIRCTINDIDYTLHSGDAVFISGFCTHYYSHSEKTDALLIVFKRSLSRELFSYIDSFRFSHRIINTTNNLYNFREILNALLADLSSNINDVTILEYDTIILIKKLIKIIQDIYPGKEQSYDDHARLIDAAKSYCKYNFQYTIKVSDVAEHLYLTPNYLSSLFIKCTGMSLPQYINYLRINKATILLTEQDMLMKDVAVNCGFGTIQTFNRCFKAVMKISPSKYKKIYAKATDRVNFENNKFL